MAAVELSVILPAYNEANRLGDTVSLVREYLRREYPSYELVIVEDASPDGTYEVSIGLAAADQSILLIHNDKRLGRGSSLKEAIMACHGRYVLYMDVDLATDIHYIKQLVESLRSGAVLATGSRLIRGAEMERPVIRDVASKAYNLFVRLLFSSKVYDHQCGFKGLNKAEIVPALDLVRDNHWFWDTELLVICQSMGFRVDEFPVAWRHNGGDNKNASKVRVLKDSVSMGRRLLGLKVRQMTGEFTIKSVDESPGIMGHH
jgi:glycosyltransferase involved in cell wall biosynthesis